VTLLDRAESVELLLKRSGASEAQREDADRLADELGDLPLALEQAAAYVEATGGTFARYLDLFHERRPDMLAFRPEDATYPESVATTWLLAFEQAEAEEPAAGGLLRLFACLAPDDLPVALIQAWDEPWPEPLDAVRTDPLVWDRAVQALLRQSLVRSDGDGGLSLHRLVQAVMWDRMGEAERETWATAAQQFMQEAINTDLPGMSGRLTEFAPLIPHALAAADLVTNHDNIRVYLMIQAAGFARLQADYQECEGLVLRALAIDEAAYGPDHPRVAIIVNNLGSVLRDRDDLDGAEDAFRRALSINEAAYGPNHPKVAGCINNLGGVLRAQGDLAGAGDAFQRALAIDENAYGPDHPNIAVAVNNLGGVLQDRGDLDGAETAFRRALTINEKEYGPDHPNVAICLNNLGGVLRDRGELDGAEAACRRALAIFEAKFGPDHPNTLLARRNLATLRR